jgi:predicted lipid-binding transport protein (Tim44 family)
MLHTFHLQRRAAISICFHHSRKHASRVLSTADASAQPAATKEGIFSRHGGKMVLGFIGGIGAWFYRSTLGTANFTALKEKVSEQWRTLPVIIMP